MTTKAILNPLPAEPEAFEVMVLELLMNAGHWPVESSREGHCLEIKIGKRTVFFASDHGAWNGRARRRDEWRLLDSHAEVAKLLGVDLRLMELDRWLDRRGALSLWQVKLKGFVLEGWHVGKGVVIVQRFTDGGGFDLYTADGTSSKIVDAFYDAERRVGMRPEVPSDDLPMTPAHVEDNLIPEPWERCKGQLHQLLPLIDWDAIEASSLDLRLLTQEEIETVATWCLAVAGDEPSLVRPMPAVLVGLAVACQDLGPEFDLLEWGERVDGDYQESVSTIVEELRSRSAG